MLAQAVAGTVAGAPASAALPVVAAPVVAAAFVLAAVCEELGWTAYATGPLIERAGAGVAGIGAVRGAFWSAAALLTRHPHTAGERQPTP
ncbi:hypothetical protein K8O92_25875 [Nocardia asteroides]|nr:hypothetical protein K8O92_25875 [Nocardia asteroides]